MRIIGIELTTPETSGLIVAALTTLACLVLAYVSMLMGLTKPSYLISSVLAALGGSMASAYGISIIKHGLRGVVLVFGFVVALIILVYAFSLLI